MNVYLIIIFILCMVRNSLLYADVPLRNYSVTEIECHRMH